MKNISERIAALREIMKREHLAAFIFPSTDPHNGEYVPEHWKGREWISGFNGSAGTAVVTMTSAALWTDSRYFIAAEEQLADTEFVLMKERVEGTPSISSWIAGQIVGLGSTEVGVDGMVNSAATVEALITELRQNGGITVRTNLDPFDTIWASRPPVPKNKVCVHPLEYAGERCADKIRRIRKKLRENHADGMLVAALDDIAWILNMRGNDVHCNPVFVSYLLISTDKATLFIDSDKLTEEVVSYLKAEGVDTAEYSDVAEGLRRYGEYNILLDPDEINYTLFNMAKCPQVIRSVSPIPAMKAVKNDAEIAGFHNAMLRDGIAMTKFLYWLKPAVEQGGQTEMSINEKLTSLRAEQKHFKGISFDTIAAYQEHGAIVHYEATPETDVALKPEGLILIDSGAQYLDGTTDITRTVALGELTDEQKHVYTLVLKGHIQLDMLKFPKGACGSQLDALARKDMWREGMNYMHGTGHGVGAYLNVHEGPHQIRMEWRSAPLFAGMTVTDEPGIYLEGKFGVRIENTLLITPYMTTQFGEFLQFEALTLCPIDITPVIMEMLTNGEKEWLNAYHEKVYEKLSPYLTDEEKEWLRSFVIQA